MTVVGLTGGIATGKSTVGRLLAASGVPVIDADLTAREVVEPGRPALQAIVAAFGPEVLNAEGRLDRATMRHRITHDADARATLEQITHPAIRVAIFERLGELQSAGHDAAVVEAALMVETGSYTLYPVLIVVACDPETQLRRVMARDGMSESEARALVATQLPLERKTEVATHVIWNDGTEDELAQRTRSVWSQITLR